MVSGERAGLKGDVVFADTFKQVQSVGWKSKFKLYYLVDRDFYS